MRNFKTIEEAKKIVYDLQSYINLAESFEPKNVEEHIIREYAYLGSLQKVSDRMKEMNYEIEVDDVRNAIQTRGKTDLHKIIRSGYMKRTRSSRRSY